MRANEFIVERKQGLHKDAQSSLPHGRQFHGADQYYNYYRLGVFIAGSPDFEAPTSGPAGDSPAAWAYSDVDEEMINHATVKMGFDSKILVKRGSLEPKDTHAVSPVNNWMKK
jgi:hypothetical protein